MIRRPAPTLRTGFLLAALITASVGVTGCTRFFPLESDADVSGDADGSVGVEDAAADADAHSPPLDAADIGPAVDDVSDLPDVVSLDADVTEAGDGSPAPDVPPEVSEDAGADTPGGVADVPQDTGPDVDVITCDDTCETPGENRCAPDAAATLERCTLDPATGCLGWAFHAECQSVDPCAGPQLCEAGVCAQDVSLQVVCPETGNPCVPLKCDPADGLCKATPIPVGGACDPGDPCTVLNKCDAAGECHGLPSANACPCTTLEDCLEFDDGNLCNGLYECNGSACVKSDEATTCAPPADPCLISVCDPSDGKCKQVAGPDGVACDDGDACSLASECIAGDCLGEDFFTCDEPACTIATCDPATGICDSEALDDCCGNAKAEANEQCDDGNPDSGDTCEPDCTFPACDTRALSFEQGCLLVPGASLTDSLDTFTIEFFIRPDAVAQDGRILDREQGLGAGQPDWYMSLVGPTGFQAVAWTEGRVSLPDVTVPGPTLNHGVWNHVALTRRLNTKTVTWWHNGLQAGTQVLDAMDPLSSSEDLWIGCRDGVDSHLHGDLDELRIRDGLAYDTSFPPTKIPFFVDDDTRLLHHFDHTNPGVSVDASPHGADGLWQGTLSSDPADWFEDKPNGKASCANTWCHRAALLFDAAAEAVGTVADPAALDPHQALTIELFVRIDDVVVGGEHVLIARDSHVQGAPDWRISVLGGPTGNGNIRWTEGQLGGNDNPIAAATPLTPGTWHHVAVARSFDPEGVSTIRWFIDGVAEVDKVLSGALSLAATSPLSIGSQGGSSGFFDGAIDELRISEGVLYSGDFPLPPGLPARHDTIALYRFDAGSGDAAYSELPAQLGPFLLEGAGWTDETAPGVPPCP